jgi:NAD+ synthase (glutamine-hydrolysing)
MLANIEQKILLATSNRSEASVGYVTMDGDSAGGLAPIAGVDKVFLRHWLKWVLMKNHRGLGPVKAFELVAAQQPTAELRPSAQTDERDLMPYEVLGEIERLLVRDKMASEEILGILMATFPSYTQNQLEAWTQKFRHLWRSNQWKRERLAPSFHLADYNVDPKSWCRFPIISGS